MSEHQIFLRGSLDAIANKVARTNDVSPRDKRDLDALNDLAGDYQERANESEYEWFFDFRNEIAELKDSDLAILA
jgi:hypothetical protein